MDELLTPVRTTYFKGKHREQLVVEARLPARLPSTIATADDALSVLKSQPDYEALIAVLRFLLPDSASAAFDIRLPSPKSAAITLVLVTEIAPNYWTLLQEGSCSSATGPAAADSSKPPVTDLACFVRCLRSIAGINAVVGQIKALIEESKGGRRDVPRPDISLHLGLFLDLLAATLEGSDSVCQLWRSSTGILVDAASKKVQSQCLTSIITNGKISSLSAEGAKLIGTDHVPNRAQWLTDGAEFSRWLGRNVVAWARILSDDAAELQAMVDVFQRCLSLGYADILVTTVIDGLLLSQASQPLLFARVCLDKSQVSRKVLFILLGYLSRSFLQDLGPRSSGPDGRISAAAGLLDAILQKDQARIAHVVSWCCSPSGAGLGDGVGIRRAVVAALASDREAITSVLEKSLNQFGDELYIKHSAIMQQEAHTQVVLLSAGYVARLCPLKLTILLRSGTYLRTVSNRIASTNARTRFLGMCVGEGLSLLQDNQAKRLNFHMEDMDTEEAQWLKGLTKTSDYPGPIEPLLSQRPPSQTVRPKAAPATATAQKAASKPKPKRQAPVSQPAPKAIIKEIDSSDDEDKDDPFPSMEKVSDPEDSDEDATLVRRDKPRPPVYIRDLITFLRDSESFDKQELGIQTAPVLIRRKANYGTEVSSHAEELARLMVGLQDKFDMDDFEDLRVQGMIALIVAQPEAMAPWFARTFFEGDYSLSQRTSILVTLGLAARETAGLETSKYQSAAAFPSKRLPAETEQLYLEPSSFALQRNNNDTSRIEHQQQLKALPPNALDSIAKSLTASFLGPLAAEAADATTGPDVLKLQTFTTRYKSRNKLSKPRVRAIPNTTAAILSTYFFSPLTAHFQFALRSSKPAVLNPALLALYLQTLAIIVNAAGPSTLALPQLTSELWLLLLRTRVHVSGHVGALRGWLVAMSVLLHVNDDNMRRLCEEHGRDMVESREWVSGVFERTRGEDGGEENDVKMLAAGILIQLGEAIETHQALLLGDLIGFS